MPWIVDLPRVRRWVSRRQDQRWLPLLILASSAIALQPSAARSAHDAYPECVSHLWSAGSRLGWAEAIARHDVSSDDADMLENIRAAAIDIERAHERCPTSPAPWPAWSNWRKTQDEIRDMSDRFGGGAITRTQLAIAISVLHQSLATQLAFRILPTHIERDSTCPETYERLGNAVGFARKAARMSGHLTPDAVIRLRQALSLIYQMRDMPPPCRDFTGLVPALNEALKHPEDPSSAERVDGIWRAGEGAAAPLKD